MQTTLAPEFRETAAGQRAQAILRNCVHCGFCTATCPSYQILGDELDGPRGRIYLIKQVLEGAPATRSVQQHLDRCLTCRNCESTCPSGVAYGELLDIGRAVVETRVRRPWQERWLRALLREGIPSPLFGPAMALGQSVRGLLPKALQRKIPPRHYAGTWPTRTHDRKVLLLAGCAQPSMTPNIHAATLRVLDAAGVQGLVAREAGCCGAVKFHLNDQAGALKQMRANIDAWWPYLDRGVEAILMNASGCGVMVKDYGHLLADDPTYADKAARVSGLTRDLSEWLPELVPLLRDKVRAPATRIAYHPPCSLQHGQRLRGGVEQHLRALGFDVQVARTESHLCCGSAGTYSILEADTALALRERKLTALDELQPQLIASANVGCITHLQSGTALPVQHWVEVLDAALQESTLNAPAR